MAERLDFLPVSKQDMQDRGWYYYDFLLVTGDAYVDHPSFGTAVISRVLEKKGYRVAILSQPNCKTTADFEAFGRPRLGVLVNSGNIDSMVAHYSVAKRRREKDLYTPGNVAGKRPDRAVIVYAKKAREAFSDMPIIIGGIEASLRRFAHYDYWADKVLRPILADSGADLLIYGMGERPVLELAARLKKNEKIEEINNILGTCIMAESAELCQSENPLVLPNFRSVEQDKKSYARAAIMEQNEQDFARGRALIQECDGRFLIQNPPMPPPEGKEFDDIFDLPYARTYHPDYEELGGVAAIEEVQHSIIHNRGCFGSCNFCALALHQGRYVTARGHESVLREAELITKSPNFKGYIHDVGGPTANFRHPACKKQKTEGACRDRQCLSPTPCPNLDADHSDYLALLRKLRAIKGVKKVFIRSGIRYDYMMQDKSGDFFAELVRYHVSGQLKVAPEHISPEVLHYMGKPFADVYERFTDKFYSLCDKYDMEQYLVPYLMSSHPGSKLEDAVKLAEYLKKNRMSPEQVQDFYPTPGTLATAMYYTGIDPRNMEPVFSAKEPEQKAMQRALLQSGNPKNRHLVYKALVECGREDLIGKGKSCLVHGTPPEKEKKPENKEIRYEPTPEKKKIRYSGAGPKKKKPDYAGKPSYAGKSDSAGKPSYAGKSDSAGKPSYAGKSDSAGKPSYAGKSDSAGKPSYAGKSNYAGKPAYDKKSAVGEAAPAAKPARAGKPVYGKKPVNKNSPWEGKPVKNERAKFGSAYKGKKPGIKREDDAKGGNK